jgi:aminopeptidase-like protein
VTADRRESDRATIKRRMMDLVDELYPLPRSITGEGVRKTLRVLQRFIPLEVHEVATGTQVLDWTVPREWTIRDAYIKDATGHRIVDFNSSNLHVVGYSVPVHATMSLAELRPHLHSLPDRPSWIPYRTSYYHETWGFCLSHDQLLALDEGPFEVRIDSDLRDGHLTYGELVLPGETRDEILVSTHICHPSLANDNLSGIAVATFLAAELQHAPRRHTVRFLFAPGTIGSLTWLSLHEHDLRVRHGLVLAGVGDGGNLTYKRSRRGDADVDRAVQIALRDSGVAHTVQDFSPWGYDERQFNSPGFNLSVGSLMRTVHGTYPEYHTSADDLGFVRPDRLQESLETCRAVVGILEADRRYLNLSPKGEPALGRRGLYSPIGGSEAPVDRLAMLWVLNLSDGSHSLIDVAERSGLAFPAISDAARSLEKAGLLEARPG